MNYNKYMKHAIEHAKEALSQGEFPVGCIIVCEEKIIATGARKKTKGFSVNEIDHAELIALKQLADDKKNISMKEVVLFCTLEPCLMCYAAIILSGIRHIVYAYEDAMGGGTSCDLSKLPHLYSNSRVTITPGIMRHESMDLFKAFFNNPDNTYWKNSYLEEYTLDKGNY